MPVSRTESLARQLFNHYLPFLKVQYGIRPDWLKWPVTGNNLELDIYFPEIKVAIEADGIQHGRPIIGMQKDFAAFERQQARDLWKLDRCRELGITLYKLTIFDMTENRMLTLLRSITCDGVYAAKGNPRLQKDLAMANDRLFRPDILIRAPKHLYLEAEKLSRQKFRPPLHKKSKPGIWRTITHLLGGS